MPWEMIEDQHSGIVTIRASEPLVVEEIAGAMRAIWSSPLYWERLRVLWDLRACALDLPVDDVRRIAVVEAEERPDLDRSRVAVLADKDLSFGLMRMLGAFMPEEKLEYLVFRDEHEAIAFLQQ